MNWQTYKDLEVELQQSKKNSQQQLKCNIDIVQAQDNPPYQGNDLVYMLQAGSNPLKKKNLPHQ